MDEGGIEREKWIGAGVLVVWATGYLAAEKKKKNLDVWKMT